MPLHGQDVEASYDAWIEALSSAGGLRPLGRETVSLELAAGRVTAEAIFASSSAPAFDAAAMDGIAVAARATAGRTGDARRGRVPHGRHGRPDACPARTRSSGARTSWWRPAPGSSVR